jgi:hypothetical protein
MKCNVLIRFKDEKRRIMELARDKANLHETLAFVSKQMNLIEQKVISLVSLSKPNSEIINNYFCL